jgi:uncharacterized protein (TIGR02996 family)
MNDLAEFLAAINAEPEDDLPRLVYADWLEEYDGERANFIRLQIRLARGERLTPAESARVERLEKRHGRSWAGKLTEWALVVGYQRGFPHSVVISAADFYEKAAELFRLAPIRQVTLIGAGNMMRYLVQLPHLDRITALHLTGCHIGDSGVEKLGDCPHLGSLQTLRLGSNGITSAGMVALATSRRLRQLRRLDLPNNEIGDWGARILAESPHLEQLEAIDLSRNDLTETGISFLRNSVSLTHLRRLDVDDQRNNAATLTV